MPITVPIVGGAIIVAALALLWIGRRQAPPGVVERDGNLYAESPRVSDGGPPDGIEPEPEGAHEEGPAEAVYGGHPGDWTEDDDETPGDDEYPPTLDVEVIAEISGEHPSLLGLDADRDIPERLWYLRDPLALPVGPHDALSSPTMQIHLIDPTRRWSAVRPVRAEAILPVDDYGQFWPPALADAAIADEMGDPDQGHTGDTAGFPAGLFAHLYEQAVPR